MLEPSDPAGLTSFATAVSTPGSPQYRQYLTRDEFASRFGATTSDVAAVERSLRALGLRPGAVSANRLVIPVSATVAALQRAFRVQLRHVTFAGDASAYSTSSLPVMPADVASMVQGIVGLANVARPRIAPHPNVSHSRQPGTAPNFKVDLASRTGAAQKAVGPQACPAVTKIAQQAAAESIPGFPNYPNSYTLLDGYYGMSPLYRSGDTGAGVTVALYEVGGYTATDIAAFQRCYGTHATVHEVHVDGGPGDMGGVEETELDIETVIGTAPGATIVVYEGPDLNATFTSYLDMYNRIVSDDTAQVFSSSYYGCEFYEASYPSFLAGENTLFEEAAAQGQSNLAIAGDTGSEGCLRLNNKEYVTSLYVADPASNPWATGVGGTANTAYESTYDASIHKHFPAEESVWNSGCPFNQINGACSAGGGGESIVYPRPSWQTGPGVVDPKYPNKAREVPDVSASADPYGYPYIIYDNGGPAGWDFSGGTSASAPLWAGVLALTDAKCRTAGVKPIGFANPALYTDAAKHPSDFYDVTANSGAQTGEPANNDVTRKHHGAYPATAGYDMATGLGTPHAARLAAHLCPPPRVR